jgi:putative transposase
MKRVHYPEEKIISILKEAEAGMPARELCRKYGVGEATFYRWRSKYAGMDISELKRIRDVEQENAQLKRIVANQALEIDAMKAVLQKKW